MKKIAENVTSDKKVISGVQTLLQEGMSLAKCRECGCMKESLETLRSSLPKIKTKGSADLLKNVEDWLKQMEPIEYSCLGCKRCIAAEAANTFYQVLPEVEENHGLSCGPEVDKRAWPPVPGEYHALCQGPECPVAVSTLGSTDLADKLASIRPEELCIVGKTETENIGIDKVIKNTITNPAIRFLVLAGQDSEGHYSGKTLLALQKNGVTEGMRVIGSPGKRPILRNVSREEVETFRRQVQAVDLIGCEDAGIIAEKIRELAQKVPVSCSCRECAEETKPVQIPTVPVVQANKPAKVKMDKAGYFVVIPQAEKRIITVEHYSYDNTLLRTIEGKDATSIYQTIVGNGWVTQLSHAAYIGKELAKAELSMKLGFRYIQDRA